MRVDKSQFPRVEHKIAAIMTVAGITYDRMSILGEVYAYLVLAPALELNLHKRGPFTHG